MVKVEVDGQVIETKPSKVMLRVSGPRRLVEAMQASALDVTVSVEEELERGDERPFEEGRNRFSIVLPI